MEDSDLQTASPSNSHVTAEAGCDWLPAEPERPLPGDCCGSGCVSPSNSHVTAEAGCDWLPAEPERPLPSDCCGSGCVSPSNSHVTAEAGCDWLPAEPEKPLPSDCCGNGCVPCVMDIYEQEMQLWREECRSRREGKPSAQQEECRSGREGKPSAQKESSDPMTAGPVLSPDKYVTFQLESIQRLTHDTTSDTNVYTFHIPENRQLGLATGQHIILRYSTSVQHITLRSVTGQYTPISPPDAKGYSQVLIKVYQTGVMSRYVRCWKVGDRVEWRGPFGTFTYRANQVREIKTAQPVVVTFLC
ncbi:NADH-cytochrome b5 reductase-like [Branchiostoma floridae]|uniref:NADH-cytochrome b5 reductase-like n=1 Tax=Branchiostoma floridae TaxID=7739 RepID=A0A9J7MCX5_BRAFL|nr:NADH-cytochrome b5 reductase-like [Branchiostoma floridae]